MPSASCCFFACFLLHRISLPNGVQTQQKNWTFFLGQKTPSGPEKHLGVPRGGHNPPGRAPGAPRWVVPTSVASRTPSWPYKFPNIPKTLGVALDHKFRRHKASVSTRSNLDPVPTPCRRGKSSPVAIFIIPAATLMRRE